MADNSDSNSGSGSASDTSAHARDPDMAFITYLGKEERIKQQRKKEMRQYNEAVEKLAGPLLERLKEEHIGAVEVAPKVYVRTTVNKTAPDAYHANNITDALLDFVRLPVEERVEVVESTGVEETLRKAADKKKQQANRKTKRAVRKKKERQKRQRTAILQAKEKAGGGDATTAAADVRQPDTAVKRPRVG